MTAYGDSPSLFRETGKQCAASRVARSAGGQGDFNVTTRRVAVPLLLGIAWFLAAIHDPVHAQAPDLPARSVELGPHVVRVAGGDALMQAMRQASAGDVITLAPGTYRVGRVEASAAGRADKPIVVRAESLGAAKIETGAVETFVVSGPYWTFENLEIVGTDPGTDHAFHIIGGASRTIIRHDRIRDFNAAIKGNGLNRRFPSDVLIADNVIHNLTLRAASGPVTPIDVDGGRRWVVRGNLIADFGKAGGNQVSFGAFMKAGSREGVFERNLIICEWQTTGGIRLGLSFGGGGGETPEICEDATCKPKHSDGIIRNNVIMHCPEDVGIYVNEGRNTKIYNNTLVDTGGIDVRFPESSADIRDNIIAGGVHNRDGGKTTLGSNVIPSASAGLFAGPALTAIFADPAKADFRLRDGREIVKRGAALPAVTEDFCGHRRDPAAADIGAVAYGAEPCDRARELYAMPAR
jgi:hypothetical protein